VSKSAENGFGAVSRAVWETGTLLHCPIQGIILASGAWEVCDVGYGWK